VNLPRENQTSFFAFSSIMAQVSTFVGMTIGTFILTLLGDHVLFDITPNITFWSTMPDALGTYLESLQKIDAYDVQVSLPAHRKTGDFHDRIAYLIGHHQRRLDQVVQIVREQPGMTAYEIAARMRWKIRCNSWEDFPVAQKWFAVGEAISHIDRLMKLGQLRAEQDNGKTVYFL